jgi:hypothetical protein
VNESKQSIRRRRRPQTLLVLLACALTLIVGGSVIGLLGRRHAVPTERSLSDVPLGVEQAVIVRSTGPPLKARPYRRGASLNVRIANQAQKGRVRIYDIRYVVNLPGEFDLTDYLTSTNGRSVDNLPPFPVQGLSSLTKDLETRIQEIDRVGIHIWHWYYESLIGVGFFWVAWLVGLIFLGRSRRPPKPAPKPRPLSIDEQINRYLDALLQGELSTRQQARLEALLLNHWRGRLSLGERRMAASCRDIEGSRELGHVYERLQAWLHNPRSDVSPAQFVAAYRSHSGRRMSFSDEHASS